MLTTSEAASDLRPIGAVAREVGLTPRAIRYYEEIGLLRPAVRVKGADRLFDASDVQRLQEIKRLREVIGFSLAEIAEILDTDAIRVQLRDRFQRSTDPAVRIDVLRDALALGERRLALVERKLAQVDALRVEEQQRIDRIRALLQEEESRDTATAASGEANGR